MIKGDLRLTIPNPHRQDIGVDLLKRILRQGGIQRDEWNEAWKQMATHFFHFLLCGLTTMCHWSQSSQDKKSQKSGESCLPREMPALWNFAISIPLGRSIFHRGLKITRINHYRIFQSTKNRGFPGEPNGTANRVLETMIITVNLL